MIALADIKRTAQQLGEAAHAERVILFGSHARGDAGEQSDVDLLIIA
jgi:predicted nucleotidyltransferase